MEATGITIAILVICGIVLVLAAGYLAYVTFDLIRTYVWLNSVKAAREARIADLKAKGYWK